MGRRILLIIVVTVLIGVGVIAWADAHGKFVDFGVEILSTLLIFTLGITAAVFGTLWGVGSVVGVVVDWVRVPWWQTLASLTDTEKYRGFPCPGAKETVTIETFKTKVKLNNGRRADLVRGEIIFAVDDPRADRTFLFEGTRVWFEHLDWEIVATYNERGHYGRGTIHILRQGEAITCTCTFAWNPDAGILLDKPVSETYRLIPLHDATKGPRAQGRAETTPPHPRPALVAPVNLTPPPQLDFDMPEAKQLAAGTPDDGPEVQQDLDDLAWFVASHQRLPRPGDQSADGDDMAAAFARLLDWHNKGRLKGDLRNQFASTVSRFLKW